MTTGVPMLGEELILDDGLTLLLSEDEIEVLGETEEEGDEDGELETEVLGELETDEDTEVLGLLETDELTLVLGLLEMDEETEVDGLLETELETEVEGDELTAAATNLAQMMVKEFGL